MKPIPPPSIRTGGIRPDKKFDYSERERAQTTILLVEPEQETRQRLRTMFRNLGFGEITSVVDHYSGLKKFDEHRFTHVLFDARNSNVPAKEFLERVLIINDQIVAMPTSYNPTVDDVFDLLKCGAQGYLVKPFTEQTLEEAVVLATKGDPISEEILNAKDRNQALAALALTALDTLATIKRQARRYDTAKLEVTRAQQQFERAIKMGQLFARDGAAGLVPAYIERAIEVSEQSASRLGRSRLRRRKRFDSGIVKTDKTSAS